MYYKEEDNYPTVEEIWQSLSPEDRDFLAYYSASEWQSGTGEDFLILSVRVTMEKIQEWVRKGILEEGTGKKFAKEWLDHTDQERIEKIKGKEAQWMDSKARQPLTKKDSFLSEEEETFLADVKTRERILAYKSDQTRYRMSSKALHDFAHSQLTD